MKTELYTISKIFNECLYRIPDYQRGYSWELQHLKDFWLDLEQLEGDKSHYTGVLTLEPVPENILASWPDDTWIVKRKKYQPYFVVDGQQRLTTTVILIQCILEINKESKLNHTAVDDIRRKYIFDSKDDISRSYIFGYVNDNPSYEYLIRNIFNEESKKHFADEDTIYTKNLKSAKSFFLELLAPMDPAKIELLYTKVTQQLVFNVYEIAKEIDVFVTFETMNNRGKLLSNLELVKNRLIFLAMKMGPDEDAATALRTSINEAWKTIYHYLGKNERRPLKDDTFLSAHMLHYFFDSLTKLPADEDEIPLAVRRLHWATEDVGRFLLNDVFTQKRVRKESDDEYPALTPKFVNSYAQALKQSVGIYYHLSTPMDSKYSIVEKSYLERLGRLKGTSPSPLVLSVYLKEKEAKKRVEFLDAWECLNFVTAVKLNAPYQRTNYLRMDHIMYVSGRRNFDELCTGLRNVTAEHFKETSITEILSEWMRNGAGYYGWRAVKYFLFEYELYLAENSKTDRTKIEWDTFCGEEFATDYNTVEHIYPQKARSQYWTDRFSKFTGPQRRMLKNSLGNLLALSKPKNSSLGNLPFPEKRGRAGSNVGYIYGSYSENQVSTASEWGPIQILERGVNMLTFMEERWKLTIGDSRAKARALGLEFLL